MIKSLFKKNKYITVSKQPFYKEESDLHEDHNKPNIPEGAWIKCDGCNKILYNKDIVNNLKVCPYCTNHFRLGASERAEILFDKGSYNKIFNDIKPLNPLEFKGYEEKIKNTIKTANENEAVVCFQGKIKGEDSLVAIMDSRFFMGSMGSVVGERITRLIEKATEEKLPLIIFTASGGARMQEGIFSLMQMAKISGALKKLHNAGGFYITVITDPTTGGVTASFAMLGDIILGEMGALVGFAGRRVIENTIKETLPEDFQTVEFLLKKGFIDKIIHRKETPHILYNLILMHKGAWYNG
ncbi:acetyl-CoA carboxylase, carboxyltransferase subunit beta [Clostridium hydrogeniformans]|uniref:acetyl-CoA carboxylase, carboxyltransferase subunit beta n=1 Tax=Clostridium hydrogeniformans TaxID=349933 RepID=UPI000489AD82|nr:acetyl-CoA carboxylase, carboxyltransferase subunit beta [Clostridium hydrogeniformans]